MNYELTKSEVGVCKSLLLNLTLRFDNCLERVTDLSTAPSEAIYCCSRDEPEYHHFEYCCQLNDLIDQHSLCLSMLLFILFLNCAMFGITLLFNLYMIVMASSTTSVVPNIETLRFLPPPNFFYDPIEESNFQFEKSSSSAVRSKSRSASSSRSGGKGSSKSKSDDSSSNASSASNPSTPKVKPKSKDVQPKLANKSASPKPLIPKARQSPLQKSKQIQNK